MSNGLKNIQSHARAYARRERLESGQPLTGYDDDAALGGLTPIDDVDMGDQSYSSPETGGAHSTPGGSSGSGASASSSSAAASFASHLQHHGQAVSAVAGYAAYGGYHHHQPTHHHHGHGYSNSVSSTGTAPGGGYGSSSATGGSSSTSTSPYLGHGNRLPSVGDMGIDAMLNRGPGGAGSGQV